MITFDEADYDAVGYDPIFQPDVDLNRRYDAVVSTETFEHFADSRRELDRIDAMLPLGGFLAVMTLFHDETTDWIDWWYLRVPSHVAFYSMRTFAWIAERYGFEEVFNDRTRFVMLRKTASR